MGLFDLPQGELYMNSALPENSIAFIDFPDHSEITEFFRQWKQATKLIYKRGKTVREEWRREDFLDD